MAKTRLTKYDREQIRDAIIAHKFTPEEAALLAEENALAIQVRAKAYGAYLKVIEEAPKGAFYEDSDCTVNISGAAIRMRFGASYQVAARVFDAHRHDKMLALPDTDKLGMKVMDWANRREAVKASRSELRQSVLATLSSFNTFDDLQKGWPEADRFITAQWRTRGEYAPQVPALAVKELSSALDLPPDEVAEAA